MDGDIGDKAKKGKKESVSVTTCIGAELFDTLERYCAATGQSKTVALERAIAAYCGDPDRDPEDGAP